MNKCVNILLIFLILLFSIGLISATEDNNIITEDILEVEETNDLNIERFNEDVSRKNSVGDVYNFTWLDNEIYKNGTNDATIDLEESTVKWNVTEPFTNGITINKTVIIKNGIIDGNNNVRMFNVTSTGNLILYDISLVNGTATYGGAIYNNGNVTINNNTFKENTANSGGAIYNNDNSILNVSYSIFYNNTANNGSAIYATSNNGFMNLSSNFWGNNTPNFNILIYNGTNYILNDYIMVNLAIDRSNNFLYKGYQLPYHVKISLNTSAYLDLNLIPSIIINVNGGESFIAQDYLNNFSRNITIINHPEFTLKLNYYDEELDNITYIVRDYDFTWLADLLYRHSGENPTVDLNGTKIRYNNEPIYLAGIHISQNVTIKNGIIDGNNYARIFSIDSNYTLTLTNITLVNGNSLVAGITPVGGSILNYGILNIYGGHYSNNTGDYGGVICNLGELNIYGGVFTNNFASRIGSVCYNEGIFNLYNSYLSNSIDNYLIFNKNNSILFLFNNTMINSINEKKIYNNGTISSEINLKIMNNSTVSGIYGDSVVLNASLKDDNENIIVGQNITLTNPTLGNIELSYYTNGVYNITYSPLFIGTFLISGSYAGGNNLTIEMGLLEIDPYQNNVSMNITQKNMVYGENQTINITLNNDATGQITLTVNNISSNKIIVNGTVIFSDLNLTGGNHIIKITYDGDNNYFSYNKTITVNISKSDDNNLALNDSEIVYSDNETITIIVNPELTGNLTVIIENETITNVPIINGTITIPKLNLPAGNHSLEIIYPGDDNFNGFNTTLDLTVLKSNKTDIIVEDVNITSSENQTLVIDINPDATGNITLNINGTEYIAPIINGTVIFPVDDLNPQNYTGTITYHGDENFNGFNTTVNFNILKSDVLLNASDIFMFYRNGTRYVAVLTDTFGNSIVNQTIFITINGVTYERETNINGTVYLNLNLLPKEYIVAVYYNGSAKYNNATVTTTLIINSTIISYDFMKYYKNGTQYQVNVLDANGNPFVNQSVEFNINGMKYSRITNNNGIASLSINLFPGNYTITATYNGLSQSNNIEVLPTLIGKNLTKNFGGSEQYEVNVLDGTGKPLANQNVIININGVFYNRISDSNGIAKLNINLNPGTYIATATWNEYSTSNKITVIS